MAKTAESDRLKLQLMAAEHVERIGNRIRQRREELGLSRDDLARKMPGKTNGNAIYRWEKGLHEARADALEALAKALDTDVSYFYVDQPDKTETPDLMGQVNGNDTEAELRAEVQDLKDMLNDIATAIEGLSTQIEATSEQSAARFESLRAELAKRSRRAA